MQRDDIVMGTCDGTDAAINVCLGFQPRRVELMNIESAALPFVLWQKGMELVTAAAAGLLTTGISDTDMDRTILAATYGISMYEGGDVIHWDPTDSRWESAAAANVSEVYVDGCYQQAAGGAAYKNYGDVVDPGRTGVNVLTAEGFTIAANCVANNDGEQLIWIAYR
jgi:hypothetical protein